MKLTRAHVRQSALLISICLVSCELALRILNFYPTYQVQIKGLAESGKLHFALDPRKLYRIIPHPRAGINSDGYRDIEFSSSPPSHLTRIAVIGDSFAMGLAVPSSDTFPKQLEKLLGDSHEVLNFGIQGYGTDQEHVVLSDDVLPLSPAGVILAVFPGNDFHDILKNRLYRLDAQGNLTESDTNPVLDAVPILRLPMLYRLLTTRRYLPAEIESGLDAAFFQDPVRIISDPPRPDEAKALLIFEKLLLEMNQRAKHSGAWFKAVIIPSFEAIQDDSRFRERAIPIERYLTNEDIAEEICSKLGIPVLNMAHAFRAWQGQPLYTSSDRHLNQHGHLEVARALRQLLMRS